MEYLCNGVSFFSYKEWTIGTWNNITEPEKHGDKWKNLATKNPFIVYGTLYWNAIKRHIYRELKQISGCLGGVGAWINCERVWANCLWWWKGSKSGLWLWLHLF